MTSDPITEHIKSAVRDVLREEGLVRADSDRRLMSYEESARYLDISVTVLREIIARGELKCVRLNGRCVRCDRRELDRFIDGRKSAA